MALKPVSVSQLNEYIGRFFSTDPILTSVSVRGEVTSINYHSSGHVYFSLSDEQSTLKCFLPADKLARLPFRPENGDAVIIYGAVTVYKKGGYYSLYVNSVELFGEGEMSSAFDRLKLKLEKEGLFDKAHKKPIPDFPKHIGVVTSSTGAAVRDIIKIITSRTAMSDVTVFPVQVQGDKAAHDISDMIKYIDREFYGSVDLLIVGRGGGSPEDLMPFNSEELARAIYACRIPVISAVGHEIDFTISDLVADMRAETPTAAAHAAVPDNAELIDKMNSYMMSIRTALSNSLMFYDLKTENIFTSLKSDIMSQLASSEADVEKAHLLLRENDPVSILEKGYASLTTKSGMQINSISEIKSGDELNIRLFDGKAGCVITYTEGDSYER